MGASVKVSGEISIPCDLAAGERLVVVVSDADGQVIGQAEVLASPPAFLPIEDKDLGVLGFERVHKLKVDR